MKDILIAIIALLVTGFIQSCGSGDTNQKKSEPAVNVAQTAEKLGEANVAIPDLYKGMAESAENKLGGLNVGDKAPNIVATTSEGAPFNLTNAVKDGPVAVVFYRGFWCGKCTKHLESLQSELAEMKERGLRIYAITPETDSHIGKTVEKTAIKIPFIHDAAHKIMDDYKVTYKVTDEYEEGVDKFAGVGLAESHGAEDAYLPVPATYLIGTDGKIFYAHYDHNYGNRATASDMLAALASI